MREWDSLPWYESRIYLKGMGWEADDKWEDQAEYEDEQEDDLAQAMSSLGVKLQIVK